MTFSSPQRSIAARLTWMNVLVCSIALFLAYASFFAYNLLSIRASAVNILSGEAKIIGANSVSAIIFDDKSTAQSTLYALSLSSDVVDAAIYTTGETPFTQYAPTGSLSFQPRPLDKNATLDHWSNGADILIGSRILLQGKPVGTIYIHAHLRGLGRQAVRFAGIAGAILLLCLGVALLVGAIFRKLLAQPIVSLAETARMVSRYRDYTLRFSPKQSYGELASLTEAFNEMLAEIQQRDKALEDARDELELRVEERTAQLKAANKELEAFSYTVAHDLRGPLDTITGISYLVQQSDEGMLNERSRQILSRIGTSVKEMSNLIDDLLNLSRATTVGLHIEPVDLGRMAASILNGLLEANPDRNVQVTVQKGCYADADPGLVHIAMQNLLRNAWKFTGRRNPGRIEFGCNRAGNQTVYYVRDNGAGFDQHFADRLFKPFQRLHAESDFAGTGIGLATVQRILARHGGKIWAEGEVEKGATFYFTFDA